MTRSLLYYADFQQEKHFTLLSHVRLSDRRHILYEVFPDVLLISSSSGLQSKNNIFAALSQLYCTSSFLGCRIACEAVFS